MNTLGSFILIASFALCIFSIFNTVFGIYKKEENKIILGQKALYANSLAVLLAFLVLLTQLARLDLSNHYVVMHSGEHLPFFYRATSIWSGSSGSLLFWNLILNGFTFIALYQAEKKGMERLPYMNLILGTLTGFFSFLAIFYNDAQPFREFRPAAVVGRGLNPLLQHWAMIIHPPILYFGYVSFAIPFAVGMSALISGRISEEWLKSIRRWAIFSWFFLGTGILLGSKWAYEELGWGGYWAWDPVENASLMPWLLASAFLHSIIVEEKRGMLKFWNMLLIILTFHFTLLGTWITRSGVLEGPHSFSKSTIGIPFISYIGISFLVYLGFLIYKRDTLKPERNFEAVTSKEGSFLFNNFLLVISCLVILLGVFSPLLYGREFKAPWYNTWSVPAGIGLLLLMGSAPLLAWRKSADKVFLSTLLKPVIIGIISAILYGLVYSRLFTKTEFTISDRLAELYSVITIGLGAFTVAGIFQEYYRGIKARRAQFTEENFFQSGLNMFFKNKRRYGGYLVHFAMVLLFVGYAGNAFKQNTSIQFLYTLTIPNSNEVVYQSYDKGFLGEYEIEASTLKIKAMKNGDPSALPSIYNTIVSQEAIYKIKRQTQVTEEMLTERRFYPQISHLTGNFEAHIPTSEPAIHSEPKEDFYIQLGAIENSVPNQENPDLPILFMDYYFNARDFSEKLEIYKRFPTQVVANLEIWINPLVKLIWAGSVLFFLSGAIILIPFGEKNE